MPKVERSLIDIPSNRQRREIPLASLQELKAKILEFGLLHAPVAQRQEDGRFILVAGERRLKTLDLIHAEGNAFEFNLELYLPGEIPLIELSRDFDLIERQGAELSENIDRVELPWQDRIKAIAFIHQLKMEVNPGQSYAETARAIVESASAATGPSSSATSASVDYVRKRVAEANVVAQHLSDPSIAKARNATEAFNLVIAKEQKAFQAELIKRRGAIISAQIEVRHGSLLEILPQLESGIFDTILADPPYGIGVDSGGFRQRTVHHHNYEDTPDAAKALLQVIVSEGFRVAKLRANMFIFCDIDLFQWLKDTCLRAGWDPFRTPITWGKSDSEGMAPWGREGFRRTTEWILFARKGQKGLFHPPIDYLRHNRVGRDEREYGPEKPESLLRELLSCSTLPGDYILDPCCGSGSTLAAARSLKMRALGIESDERAFNISLVKANEENPNAPLLDERSNSNDATMSL